MRLSRNAGLFWFAIFATFWYFAFVNDWGNFWHGGTALGSIVTSASAVLGVLAFVDLLRSDARLPIKVILGIVAIPMTIFAGTAVAYAGKYLLAA